MEGDVMQVNEENFRDFTSEDVVNAVGIVKHCFDADAPRNLIHYFHFMLRDGELFGNVQLSPIERAFVNYVGYAFARIAEEGKSTQVAFGLQLGRGEYPREDTTDRDLTAAAHVTLLMRNNWTWVDAKGEAANLLFPDGKGEKAVEEAYRKYKETLWILPNKTLTLMLPEGTPVIKRDMPG
jgi:hypothetical protein